MDSTSNNSGLSQIKVKIEPMENTDDYYSNQQVNVITFLKLPSTKPQFFFVAAVSKPKRATKLELLHYGIHGQH